MELNLLTAISPIDGRYFKLTKSLRYIFSEYSFLKYRLQVEILWLKKLINMYKILKIQKIKNKDILFIDDILKNFTIKDAMYIKDIEKKLIMM